MTLITLITLKGQLRGVTQEISSQLASVSTKVATVQEGQLRQLRASVVSLMITIMRMIRMMRQ